MKRARVAAAAACVLALAWASLPAEAIRLSRRSAADRESAAPLREASLAPVLDGATPAPGWREAHEKLPDRCRAPETLDAAPCDDDLRCAWLAARAGALAAWSAGGSRGERARASGRLQRVADRLGAGGACGLEDEELERWEADRRSAALDAAAAQLAVLRETDPAAGEPVLPRERQRQVEELLSRASRGGIASVPPNDLVRARPALRTAWARRSWLDAHPNLATLRRLVRERWSGLGGVPSGCGDVLLDDNLLADEWRGHLVRSGVPAAVDCLGVRLPREASRRGKTVADATAAGRLAADLARSASEDAGGRTFARDRGASRALDELGRALAWSARAATPPRPPPPRPPAATPPPPVSAAPRAAAPRPAARAEPSRPVEAPSRIAADPPAGPTLRDVVGLARAVASTLGTDRDYRRDAERASTPARRQQLVQRMHVDVHRRLCAPLEQVYPEDRSEARAILAGLGVRADERACAVRDEHEALLRLLAAAPGLEKLRAAATFRHAARSIALGREAEALDMLFQLPREGRGATWTILTSWALRRRGEHVEASRLLATLDGDLLDRLRAAGDEDLARLVAHAWVTPQN